MSAAAPTPSWGVTPAFARIARPFAELGAGVLRVEKVGNIAAPGRMAGVAD